MIIDFVHGITNLVKEVNDLEPLYYENGLLYISSRELIQNGKIIGDNMFSMIVEHIYGQVDIDTKSDMDYAEYILKNK